MRFWPTTFVVLAKQPQACRASIGTDGRSMLAGKYNESVFRGIDYILALSGKYNVKVSSSSLQEQQILGLEGLDVIDHLLT